MEGFKIFGATIAKISNLKTLDNFPMKEAMLHGVEETLDEAIDMNSNAQVLESRILYLVSLARL